MSKKMHALEPGSWCEVETSLKGKQVLKIVGYRGEMIHCVDDNGRMAMFRPNSAKIVRIFQVGVDGEVLESDKDSR
jgi:hypothetical protein